MIGIYVKTKSLKSVGYDVEMDGEETKIDYFFKY